MRNVRIGTRGSRLALTQARWVCERLKKRFKRCRFNLVVIRTTGDEFQSVELFKKTNIGVFTKAIESKLLSSEIDIAVHSLKDLPTELPEGLMLAAVPKRLDTRDMLISRSAWTLDRLPQGSSVGTGSPRRKRQLARLRPDLKLVDIRGNLDTRVRRTVREGRYDAVVLAHAGLLRLKKYLKYAKPIPSEDLMPAVGQAALGIQIRRSDKEVFSMVRSLNHAVSEKRVTAERAFLAALKGGCRVPVGINTRVSGKRLHIKAAVFSVRSVKGLDGSIEGPLKDGESLAKKLAHRLIKKGAVKFLREAREI